MPDPDQTGAPGTAGRPPRPTVTPALRRCIGIDPDEFAQSHWAQTPLLTKAGDPARPDGPGFGAGFGDLFSASAVDELVSERGLRTPFLRMAKDGSVLATSRFTRGGGAGATVTDQVADDKVLAQLAGGATLVLQALHRTWPPLVRFGSELAAELGHPVQINAYVTPPQNQGFAAHYDTHDVFVLQIAGTKRWRIHEPVLADPLPHQTWDGRADLVRARAAEDPLIDTRLEPGDALYLPRGFLHSAVAQRELSIHLTIGVHPLTGYDLARELIAAAEGDRELRRSLPMGVDVTDADVMAGHLRAVSRRLAARLTETGAGQDTDVARRLGRLHAGQTRPAPLAPLAQLAAIAGLGPQTALVLRPALRPRLRRRGDGWALGLIDTTVTWPDQVHAALLVVLAGKEFTPTALPNLDPDEQLVVARRLLREGIVVPSDPAGLDGD